METFDFSCIKTMVIIIDCESSKFCVQFSKFFCQRLRAEKKTLKFISCPRFNHVEKVYHDEVFGVFVFVSLLVRQFRCEHFFPSFAASFLRFHTVFGRTFEDTYCLLVSIASHLFLFSWMNA